MRSDTINIYVEMLVICLGKVIFSNAVQCTARLLRTVNGCVLSHTLSEKYLDMYRRPLILPSDRRTALDKSVC